MEWVIGIIVVVIILAAMGKGARCSVCNLPIKKTSYKWKIDGKWQKLCPKCNSQMERKVSKEAFKNKFG